MQKNNIFSEGSMGKILQKTMIKQPYLPSPPREMENPWTARTLALAFAALPLDSLAWNMPYKVGPYDRYKWS